MKHSSKISPVQQNEITTIQTLRERAYNMLSVADYLEATHNFNRTHGVSGAGNSGTRLGPQLVKRRTLSAAARKKIASAAKARWAKQKGNVTAGKTTNTKTAAAA